MNALERCVVLSRDAFITEMDLPLSIRQSQDDLLDTDEVETAPFDLPLEAVEKMTVLRTLQSAQGNKSEAARRLGITRRTLHKKLKKYGVM